MASPADRSRREAALTRERQYVQAELRGGRNPGEFHSLIDSCVAAVISEARSIPADLRRVNAQRDLLVEAAKPVVAHLAKIGSFGGTDEIYEGFCDALRSAGVNISVVEATEVRDPR